MPNQFLSDEFGDIEDYFVTDYRLIDNFVGDQLWVWGENAYGGLGINNTTNRQTPVTTFAGGTNWKQVSNGNKFTTAIKTDGTLWVWGRGGATELGNNAAGDRSTPVTTFAGGNNWKQVSAKFGFTAAIKTDGSLWGWGVNAQGQLGINNTNTFISTPVTTFTGGNNWKSVAAGTNHTAAIKTDGSLWLWGLGGDGVLGTNDTTQRQIPVTTFAGGNDWKQVSGGQGFTAAIKTDGSLWVWGTNSYGRLGINNNATYRQTPVTTFAGGNNWKQVSCGFKFMSAIKTDGSLWTWGLGTAGQLGNFADTNRSTPVTTFAGGTNWKSVSCGNGHMAAIKTDGSLWVWGASNSRALGIPGAGPGSPHRNTPITTFAGGNNWKQVVAGYQETIAVKSGLNVDLSFFPIPTVVTSGLRLYLDAGVLNSYPGTGTTWTDLSGNANNGTLANMDGTNFNSANGGSLTFNGSDEFVDFAAEFNLQPTAGITVSVWFKTTAANTYLINKSSGSGADGYRLFGNANGTMSFAVRSVLATTSGTITTGGWLNIVGTWIPSTSVLIYQNGTQVGSNIDFIPGSINYPAELLEIGRNASGTQGWSGNIAQTLIYNRALTATEIQQNFNFSKPRFGL